MHRSIIVAIPIARFGVLLAINLFHLSDAGVCGLCDGGLFAFEPAEFLFESLVSGFGGDPALPLLLVAGDEASVSGSIQMSWPLCHRTDQAQGGPVALQYVVVEPVDGYWLVAACYEAISGQLGAAVRSGFVEALRIP